MNLGDFLALGMDEQRQILDAASRQSRSKALLAELFNDLQRIDETSILPDGDWVSVCVATWATEWVKRLKDAGFITANAEHQARVLPSPECSCSALDGGTK